MQQHQKPCKDCPFARTTERGMLGGSPPEVYLGQAVLPFWLPCHSSPNYAGKASRADRVCQCAGAAIFRANNRLQFERPLLSLPPDTETVFATYAEFYYHHKNGSVSLTQAEAMLTPYALRMLALTELNKISDRNIQLVPRHAT